MQKKSVVITGIGILSSLGEGVDVHWNALNERKQPILNTQDFAPYIVHPLCEVDWNAQIPKRSDQRQMEAWQRIGTYAAGLALDDAGMKGNEALTSTMDMIVAAGGGERDIDVDTQILAKARETSDRGTMLNTMLSTELRPTLFLAQLSNLLAGNISIVHKVTGSSRTFMGEEASGIAALDVAVKRIAAGQSTHALIGGSYNSSHFDMLLGQELNRLLKNDGWAPVWERDTSSPSGLITGSGGVFLVLENAEHAKARNAKIYAEIHSVLAEQTNRQHKPLGKTIATMLDTIKKDEDLFLVSSASGVSVPTVEEKNILDKTGIHYRAMSTLLGHMREAQFPFAVALAAIALKNKCAFSPLSKDETALENPIHSAIVSGIGIHRGEGFARLTAI